MPHKRRRKASPVPQSVPSGPRGWLRWPEDGILIALLAAVLLILFLFPANSRPGGDFATDDEVGAMIHQWVVDLHQPGTRTSCCGDADLYFADKTDACTPADGCDPQTTAYVAIVTDTRGSDYDEKVGRIPRAPGTRVPIPSGTIQLKDGNPTEHGVLFINTAGGAICFVPLAGN